jgi:2-hydroxy-3-oxopropionate reductase
MTNVGFIGLGVMGRPMATNLLRAGFPLIVYSRSSPPVDELVRAGARRGASPADVAAGAEVILTMLPDTSDVETVLLGEGGVVSGIAQGSVVIDMSTIDPLAARRFGERVSEHGASFIDAPVSGGERGAIDRSLSIMVGGETDVIDRVMPILSAMGRTVVRVGPVGAGQVAKACNQLIVGATIQAVAEALALASAVGVDASKVREALLGGFASSRVLEVHGRRMLERDFTPGFRIALHRKDARIVLDTARTAGQAIPAFEVVAGAFEQLVASGGGDLDHAALITLLEPG